MNKKIELRKQQKIWDRILKKSGFIDIENGLGKNNDYGIAGDDPKVRKYMKDNLIYKEYLDRCRDFLNEYPWWEQSKGYRDNVIWELHCESKALRTICDDLSETIGVRISHEGVRKILNKYKKIMEIYYS